MINQVGPMLIRRCWLDYDRGCMEGESSALDRVYGLTECMLGYYRRG